MSGFLGIENANRDAAICVTGVPYDGGVSGRRGAVLGPKAIRQASRMLIGGVHPAFLAEPATCDVADIGDLLHGAESAVAPELMMQLVGERAAPIDHLVTLGGDHSITLPLLRVLSGRIGQPLRLVHFDAHMDTWPELDGVKYGHASPIYHAIQERLIDPSGSVQVGIRSPAPHHVRDWTLETGITIISAEEVHDRGPEAISEIIRAVVDGPAYLTFDIDALDPAFAPGTGTPEVGGLATWQAQSIIRRLDAIDFRGMDVVEVSPPHDYVGITALAAATIAWEYLALTATR